MYLEIGDVIDDRYKIVEELGKGGFGKTFLAEDSLRFDDRCVVKQFIYERSENNQEARELFREEAKILLNLENYSQTPNLFAYVHEKDCLVQEFIQGQTLEAEFEEQGTFSEQKIGLPAKKAIPSLTKRLRDKKSGVRAYASWALGKMGSEAKDAIPVLLETLRDEKNEDAFIAGLEALKVIGYDISTININFDDGTTSNAKEHITFQREEQAKALEAQRNSSRGGLYNEWRRPLSANTPPQI